MIRFYIDSAGRKRLQTLDVIKAHETGAKQWMDVPTVNEVVNPPSEHTGTEGCPTCTAAKVPAGRDYAACFGVIHGATMTIKHTPEPRKAREVWLTKSAHEYISKAPVVASSAELIHFREVLPEEPCQHAWNWSDAYPEVECCLCGVRKDKA